MRNPVTSNKMRAKCLGEPFKGIYGTCPQAIKPSHCHGSQTGWEHLTHQGLVLGMDSHSLVEMAQRLAHNVISQAFVRRALILMFVMVLLIVGERLTGWGP